MSLSAIGKKRSLAMEVLSGRLWWSTEECFVRTPDLVDAKAFAVEELSDCVYCIPHYTPEAAGRAFGPFGLDRVLQFCSELQRGIDLHSKIVLTCPADDIKMLTNTAVLLGAYLVLWCQWSSSKVADVLGSLHGKKYFPCSWARVSLPEPKGTLRVRDCWEGLEQAVKHGWLDPIEIMNPSALPKFILEYQKMAYQYDGSWIVPGFVFVCADPISTALDPNPVTFTRMYPWEDEHDEQHNRDGDTDSTPSPSTLGHHATPVEPHSDSDSVNTVCKPYGEYHNGDSFGKAMSFTELLKDLGIKLIVRTNYTSEPGLEQSYAAKHIKAEGIDHLEMPFADVQGAVPRTAEFAALLSHCQPYLNGSQGGIALHCKGGFGRSMCCASKIISLRYGIPGRALLGWIRIARPGAVNTPDQEMFIVSLNSTTSDVRNADSSARPIPRCGCSVQ